MVKRDVPLLVRFGNGDAVHFTITADMGTNALYKAVVELCVGHGGGTGTRLYVEWGGKKARQVYTRSDLAAIQDAIQYTPCSRLKAVIVTEEEYLANFFENLPERPAKRQCLDKSQARSFEATCSTASLTRGAIADGMLDLARIRIAHPLPKVMVFGAHLAARFIAERMAETPLSCLTIACGTLVDADRIADGFLDTQTTALDVHDAQELERAFGPHDIIISLVPQCALVVEAATRSGTHVVTPYPVPSDLKTKIEKSCITVIEDASFERGVKQLYAGTLIKEVHAEGGKVIEFTSCDGLMPTPSCTNNPFGHELPGRSRDVFLSFLESSSFYRDGKEVDVKGGRDVFALIEPRYVLSAFASAFQPMGDSKPVRAAYDIPEAETVICGALRHQGFAHFVEAALDIGYLNRDEAHWLKGDGLTLAKITQKLTGAPDASEASLVKHIKLRHNFSNQCEEDQVLAGLKWCGAFSSSPITVRSANLLDVFCDGIDARMEREDEDDVSDCFLAQQRFVVEHKDGSRDVVKLNLAAHGSARRGGSALAHTVGVPCSVGVQLLLEEDILRPGLYAPYSASVAKRYHEMMASQGIYFKTVK